ncbi:hypothetical protein GCM10010254_33750 [Streptomyces chromofuscus]|nr:hypothetical protein GCM10010254_33750 [Streptomyces chromofuscus]
MPRIKSPALLVAASGADREGHGLGPCRQTPACPATPGTHARRVAEPPTWLRHEGSATGAATRA